MCLRFVYDDNLVPRTVVITEELGSFHPSCVVRRRYMVGFRPLLQTEPPARRSTVAAKMVRLRRSSIATRGRTVSLPFSWRLRTSGAGDRVAARCKRRDPSPQCPTVMIIYVDGGNPLVACLRELLARGCELSTACCLFRRKRVAGCSCPPPPADNGRRVTGYPIPRWGEVSCSTGATLRARHDGIPSNVTPS